MSAGNPQEEEKKEKSQHYSEKKTAFEELAEEHGVELKETTPMLGIKYCQKCGYANTPDDDYCFNCHSPFTQYDLFGKAIQTLEQEEDESEQPKVKKKKKKE